MADSILSPITRTILSRKVAESLRYAILSGELVGGQHLSEAGMATKFGVSRVPVREALVELEREGIVVFGTNGRAYVREFTDEDFAEIKSMRTTLQVMSVKLAAVKHTNEDLERLEAILILAAKTCDLTEFSRLDIAFHHEIVVIARHQRLYQCWSNLRTQMEFWLARAFRELVKLNYNTRNLAMRTHRELIEALKTRRPDEAAQLMEYYCNDI